MNQTLSNEMIVRAWKDPKVRAQLGAIAPSSPAGSVRLVASELVGDTYQTSPGCTEFGPRCSLGPLCD